MPTDVPDPTGGPCRCWTRNSGTHHGHCCFDRYNPDTLQVTCGHDQAGMAAHAQLVGTEPPC